MSTVALSDLPALVLTCYPNQAAADDATLAADRAGLPYLIVAGCEMSVELWVQVELLLLTYRDEHQGRMAIAARAAAGAL